MQIHHRHHVAAGAYYVSEQKPLLLQAFLGTGVGGALHCKATGIGGMIHLLLPEPVSRLQAGQAEKYAVTGIPLLVEAMLAMGAKRDAMEAVIAGGALVGPISGQDLGLDIGGRTVEAARSVLDSYGIGIKQSETGGFFTCSINLDMNTGECIIEPIGHKHIDDTRSMVQPDGNAIKKSIDRLQPIPQVALKVMRLIDEQDQNIDTIADEIRKDQVITARTLSLANSAIFTKKRPIESLDHALVFLGQDQVVKLIISAAVQSYFEQSAIGYSLCKGGLYHHAIGCAVTAEAIAVKTGTGDPAKAYTAGLLHDIGKVVLDQHIASIYPLFYRSTIEQQHESVLAIEKKLLGIDHTQVGRLLAEKWSIPESLANTIKHHHYPGRNGEFNDLTMIVYLADLVLSRFLIGFELERVATDALDAHLKRIGLTTGQFEELVDLVPPSVLNAMANVA
ncbi:MAG: HDOD domain-containing protein [Desulfatitalea sp.]|nr:HDOD domain-containing protein [Desulfatitalea sp.]NNJ99854.1 HDOD domain-containing protein [Desulfatitalea sp.]